MEIILLIVLLVMLWLLSLIFAFVLGFLFKGKLHILPRKKSAQRAEEKELKKVLREYENFMSYSGVPQDVISDE